MSVDIVTQRRQVVNRAVLRPVVADGKLLVPYGKDCGSWV